MKRSLILCGLFWCLITTIKAQMVTDTTAKDSLRYVPNQKPIITIGETGTAAKKTAPATQTLKSTTATNQTILSSASASEDVGKSPISVDVSPTGAGTFSMPIAVPGGVGGFTPEVALAYNSQSGNGIAGYGWNLAGLSSITRIPSTKYHNGVIREVKLDDKDHYALDGQRLILKTGTYGGDGAEYQTEAYSNMRIFSRGTIGTNFGPESFEVWYPDGSKAFYGLTANSRTPTEYAISYRANAIGARINYTYINVNDKVLYIADIRYGIIGSGNGFNNIHFSYETALRGEQAYIAAQSFYRDQLMNKISVSVNGTNIRHYKLFYTDLCEINYQRLSRITEYNGDESKSLIPIYLNYGDGDSDIAIPKTISNLSLSGITNQNSQTLFADLTGNGTTDIVVYPTTKHKFYGFLDVEEDSPYLQWGYEVNTGTFKEIFPATWLTHNNKVLAGQGLVVVKDQGTSYKFDVLSTGTSSPFYFQYDRIWDGVPMGPNFYSTCDNEVYTGQPLKIDFISGDFNGDGLTDVIGISDGSAIIGKAPDPVIGDWSCDYVYGSVGSSAYLINLDRRITNNFVTNLGLLSQHHYYGSRLYTGDFNGDGKTDILQLLYGTMLVYTVNANNTLQVLWQTTDPRITTSLAPLLGDYNGDGKVDIIFPTASDNGWINNQGNYFYATFISNGNSFIKYEQNYAFSSSWGSSGGAINGQAVENRTYLIPTDINGDGKTDMVYTNVNTLGNTGSGEFKFIAYNNMGSAANGTPIFTKGQEGQRTTILRKDAIPVVLPNEAINTNLEVGFLSNNTLSTYEFKHNERNITLTSVWQNYVSYDLEYEKLMSNSYTGIYTTQFNQTFPNVDFENAPTLWVVAKMKRQFRNDILQQTFSYANAVSNTEGLGFLGFGKTIRSNWHVAGYDPQLMYSVTLTNPQLRGAVTKSFTTKNYSLGNTSNTNAYQPDVTLAAAETNTRTETATNTITLLPGFEANGTNGTFIATIQDAQSGIVDGGTLTDYITRTDYTYRTQTLANKVFINVPTSVATKDLLSGTNTLQVNEYDGYYNLTKTTTNLSGAGAKTEEITYDNNPAGYYIGRPLTKKTTASSAGDTHTSEEQFTYTGALPTQIKRKGNGTAWLTENLQYDVFGNVTQKSIVTNTGTRTTSATYDLTGRFPISTTDVEGMVATSTYDPVMGTVLTSTNPFLQTESYLYDTWGRQIQATDYLGKKAYQSYVSDGYGGVIATQTNDEGAETITYTNALGQTTQSTSKTVLGGLIGKATEYDIYGRPFKVSQPAAPNNYTQWNETEYDEYGRVKRNTSYTGKVANISYSGLSTTVNDGTKSITTVKNALGQTASVQDPGGTINYTYFATGNLKTADYGGSIQSLRYDGWGRKTKLTDPSAGEYTYAYNDFGELIQEVTPKGTTNYSYGPTGNLLSKTVTGDQTNLGYVYQTNPTTKLLESVAFTNSDGNHTTYTYTYDNQFRPLTTIEDNTQARFEKSYTYDAFGRLATETSQALNKRTAQNVSRTIAFGYQNGELLQSVDQATGQVIAKVNSLNNMGLLATEQQGTNLLTNHGYDNFNLPQSSTLTKSGWPTPLMTLGYNFDAQRGNLTSRTNSAVGWNESFTYDNLDRLKTMTNNNTNQSQSQDYDSRGRITFNSELGNYEYSGVGYQQTELTSPTAAATTWYQSHHKQQVTYNALKQPVNITETGLAQIDFQFNGAGERSHVYYGSNDADKLSRPMRRHYSENGSMEITEDLVNGTVDFVFYLNGDAYTAPAIYKATANQQTNQTTGQLYYLHRDHLGSILMITNQQGDIVEKRQFDAWGNIVKLEDGLGNPLAVFAILDRGYTGHEHLFSVGLIHMNGRLYDPQLHRFVQPDDYVQEPYNTQNYNRYGYGLNNPLIYSDPSGKVFWLVPVLIGAAISITTNGIQNAINDRPFFQGAFKAGVIGGLTGLASFGIGNVASTMTGFGKAAFQTVAHSYLGGFSSVASGGDFLSGMASGALGSLAGFGMEKALGGASGFWKATGTIAGGAVMGGIGAEISGGSFWDGFRNGAISTGLNHAAHLTAMELSGMNDANKALNAEQVIDQIMKLKSDQSFTGDDIANMNPSLSKADNIIKSIVRNQQGFQLNLTWTGRQLLSLTNIIIKDGSNFKVESMNNKGDRIYHIVSPGNKLYYGKKLVDVNIYVNNNNWSIYKNLPRYYKAWK